METRLNDRKFDTGAFRKAQVKKYHKTNKHDDVAAEFLEKELAERTKELTKLFLKVKKESIVSRSWNRGVLKATQER